MTKQLPNAPAGMTADVVNDATVVLPESGCGERLSIHICQPGSPNDLMLTISRGGEVLGWYSLTVEQAKYVHMHLGHLIALKETLLSGGGRA